MRKPLTMTVEQEKADRAASRFMDRCGMAEAGSADAAALRAWTEVDALRAALAAAEAKLADERRHALDLWYLAASLHDDTGVSIDEKASASRSRMSASSGDSIRNATPRPSDISHAIRAAGAGMPRVSFDRRCFSSASSKGDR